MLNNDLPKSSLSPVHRATVASLINKDDDAPPAQRQPTAPSPVVPLPPAPLEESPRDDTGALSRKRPRIDDSPQPVSARRSASAAPSSGQRTGTVAEQSPVQRSNSVIMLNEPLIGLEPSIINIQPSEELSRFISDFIFLHLIESGTEHLEVHALSGWFC